jgi:hypothetical protein
VALAEKTREEWPRGPDLIEAELDDQVVLGLLASIPRW